jgi:hypothetical protein
MLFLQVLEHRHHRLHRVPARASFFKSSTLHLRTLCFCQVRVYSCRVHSDTHIVFKSLASPPTCLHQGVRSRVCSLCPQPVVPRVRALAALQHIPHDVLGRTDPLLLPGVAASGLQHENQPAHSPPVSPLGPRALLPQVPHASRRHVPLHKIKTTICIK